MRPSNASPFESFYHEAEQRLQLQNIERYLAIQKCFLSFYLSSTSFNGTYHVSAKTAKVKYIVDMCSVCSSLNMWSCGEAVKMGE